MGNCKNMQRLNLKSKIFLDGADPKESRKTKEILGFLDGQTTNPTLVAKNPEIQKTIGEGRKFSEKELYSFYQKTIRQISKITKGPISIEVYADKNTKSEQMLRQAKEMANWTPNAYIKLPITKEGLKTAELLTKEGIPVNLTLCFSQEQAAAVYSATKGAKKPVFISPFIGRLDDKGENGLNLVENILKMFKSGDGHALLLTASVRNLNHLIFSIKISSPLITVPFKIIQEWVDKNFILPDKNIDYPQNNLKLIPYQEISLNRNWQDYDIYHPLTEAGIEKFCNDWQGLLKNN